MRVLKGSSCGCHAGIADIVKKCEHQQLQPRLQADNLQTFLQLAVPTSCYLGFSVISV